jgi:hypothetical protein
MAANTVWRRGGNCSAAAADICETLIAQGRPSLDANLLAELAVTDKVTCSEVEALALLRAEYNKQQGRCRGGIRAGLARKRV